MAFQDAVHPAGRSIQARCASPPHPWFSQRWRCPAAEAVAPAPVRPARPRGTRPQAPSTPLRSARRRRACPSPGGTASRAGSAARCGGPTDSGAALVMGGLDSADASSSAIVRVAGRRAQPAGHLPAALHDAAAATVGARTLFMGGGNAELPPVRPSTSCRRACDHPRRLAARRRLPTSRRPRSAGRSTWSAATTARSRSTRSCASTRRPLPAVVAHMPQPVALRGRCRPPAGRVVIAGRHRRASTRPTRSSSFDPAHAPGRPSAPSAVADHSCRSGVRRASRSSSSAGAGTA